MQLLLNELKQYVEEKFSHTDYFGDPIKDVRVRILPDDAGEALYFIMEAVQSGETKVLMKKLMQFVANKQDLISDPEIEKEYIHTMRKQLQTYFQETFDVKVSDNILFHCTYVVSAATHHGIKERLASLAHYMTLLPSMQLYERITIPEQEEEDFIVDITDEEKQKLIDNEYLDEAEARFVNIWYLQDPVVSKMVFTLMRGNDEAEMRFRKTLENR